MHPRYGRCMRTTIRLDDDLLGETKTLAAETGRTRTAVIEDALREQLARRATPREPVELPTIGGGRILPGADLDDNAAVGDVMDGLADPS
jgi:hypothetical protein